MRMNSAKGTPFLSLILLLANPQQRRKDLGQVSLEDYIRLHFNFIITFVKDMLCCFRILVFFAGFSPFRGQLYTLVHGVMVRLRVSVHSTKVPSSSGYNFFLN